MNNLLVAIDFSDATQKVIEQAIKFSKQSEYDLILVHVASPNPDFIGDDVGPQVIRDQKAEHYRRHHKMLQNLAKETEARGVQAKPLLIQGVIVDELLKSSVKHDCDFIIAGSHGHGAMYNLLVGSVVEGLIKDSQKPVLVVPVQKN